jgi:uncharacterized protein YkuJ
MSKLSEEELTRRHNLAHEMGNVTQAHADTEEWSYTCTVEPVYLSDDNDKFRITISGCAAEERTRFESFDLITMRAYCKMMQEVIQKFDNGEIKNPW